MLSSSLCLYTWLHLTLHFACIGPARTVRALCLWDYRSYLMAQKFKYVFQSERDGNFITKFIVLGPSCSTVLLSTAYFPIWGHCYYYIVALYRPISILPVVTQTAEKLLQKWLAGCLDKSNILCSSQFSFQSRCSIELLLFHLLNA